MRTWVKVGLVVAAGAGLVLLARRAIARPTVPVIHGDDIHIYHDEYTMGPPVCRGSYWHEPLEVWKCLPDPGKSVEIPAGSEVYFLIDCVNAWTSDVLLNASLVVRKPDGTVLTPEAKEKDVRRGPNRGRMIPFEPVIFDQKGNYTLEATLSGRPV